MATEGSDIKKLKPRSYQSQIIEVCIAKNSIVYLPTGSGKTFIAFEVFKYFSKDLERSIIDENGKRSVFLVNTVCLAKQHAENLKLTFPYKIGIFTGEDNVDAWRKENWQEQIQTHQIVVATTQVILDAVKHGFIKISNFNVIVFDECHHGRKEHPMHELMNQFKYVDAIDQPRVIGLSGMLISVKTPNKVYEEINFLESTFQSTIVTVNKLDDRENVLLFSTNPNENFIQYESPIQFSGIIKPIEEMVYKICQTLSEVRIDNCIAINPKTLKPGVPKKTKTLINLFQDFLYELKELGPYGGYLSALSITIQFELMLQTCELSEYSKIIKHCITYSELFSHELEKYMSSIKDQGTKILNFSSTKVRKFVYLLKNKFNNPDKPNDLQCLVFVKRRYTAKCLYHLLKEYAENTEDFPIRPDFMVGCNNQLPESIAEILSSNNNKLTLRKFSNGETNVVCSSSVLEEGIDLQMTNLVIMFDHPETYRSYVQSKGRARVRDSDYMVLVHQDLVAKFKIQIDNYKKIDSELQKMLVEKSCDRLLPSDEDIETEQKEHWPPYITPSKAILNSTSCISLLNRYTSMIPRDKFSNTNVEWERIEENDLITVSIKLPNNSKIKEKVIGYPFKDLRLAKRSAAFRACKMLHEIGELNDNLMPIDNKKKVEEFNQVYFPHWNKYKDDENKNAGTRVHRRYHSINYPEQLTNCTPKVSYENYLYLINVSPGFDRKECQNESVEVFRELLLSNQCFGILTNNKKKLPRLCAMRLFKSFGQIDVNLDVTPKTVQISSKHNLDALRDFHIMIFRDLLKVWQKFFVFDGESYLIVPTIGDNINWPVVFEFPRLQEPRMMNFIEKKNMVFKPEDFLHKVICPVYRANSENLSYIVTHVMTDMTAESEFANNSFATYKDYFECNYNLAIQQKDQFLIQVKGIGNNLNLLFPGGGKQGKTKKYERSKMTQREIYIPEICHNYMISGDLWLKATLLPCVLHRIHYMLLAETLRVSLMDRLRITDNMPQQYCLDIEYEDYEERRNEAAEDQVKEDLEEVDSYEKPQMNFETKQNVDAFLDDLSKLNTLQELPLDLDRNWTKVRQIDISYYTNFVKEHRSSSLMGLPQTENIHDRTLMENEAHQHIQLIQKGRPNNLQQKDLIKVLTTSRAADVFDMERFEVLGDGYLKFITSLYLYKKFDDWHEGYLTTLKGKLVSNRNLFYCGNDFELTGSIKTTGFQPKVEWMAPSIGIPRNIREALSKDSYLLNELYNLNTLSDQEVTNGNLSDDSLAVFKRRMIYAQETSNESFNINSADNGMLGFIGKQYLGDKIVADCVEAVLGVTVQSLGLTTSLEMLKIFKVFPEDENVAKLLSERIPPRILRSEVKKQDVDMHPFAYKRLQEILEYDFKDRTYLLQAVTHSTYRRNNITSSYQELEFLGDAVLDFLITAYIFEQCPKMDPGKLTDLRSALVNNITLSCITVRHDIHCHLLSQNHLLTGIIKEFVRYQKSQNHEITDQIMLLMNDDDENGEEDATAHSVDVPKALGDLFESIVGAIFLDSGLDLVVTWNVIYRLMSRELNQFKTNVPKNMIRRLFEYPKANPKFLPAADVGEKLVSVPLEFKCKNVLHTVYGIGMNKSLAKKAATKLALQKLIKAEAASVDA